MSSIWGVFSGFICPAGFHGSERYYGQNRADARYRVKNARYVPRENNEHNEHFEHSHYNMINIAYKLHQNNTIIMLKVNISSHSRK